MKPIISIFLLFLSFGIYSQKSDFSVIGKVVTSTGQSIGYATVTAIDKDSGVLVTGTTTEENGEFRLNLKSKNITLEVDFIGFAKAKVEDVNFSEYISNIGIIELVEDSEMIEEVVVRAEKSTTEFKLDKRVFNVGSDLSSTGASALEVLNNVPSVNVSIEGQVSLRGATGVQMLINGKPSVLADESGNALGSITADMIEKVEVITNPSAKYEAEGTAGIINIVLKKEEKKGVNGSLSINTGLPHNHSIGFSLNRRTEKFNLFSQFGVGYRELPTDTENINNNLQSNTILSSHGKEFRNENFYNIILGTDYYFNPNNILTLSGSFAYEIEDQPSETGFSLLSDGILEEQWTRTETTEATNPKLQYELQYKREFTDNKDHQLLFSAIGNYFGKDQSSVFTNNYSIGQSLFGDQYTATTFKEGKYTFKLDYTKPIGDHWTLETGAQYLMNNVSNDFEVSNELDGVIVLDPHQTNVFEYDQKVLGIYTTGAYEGELWGLKLGLRMENTDLTTFLINTNEDNSQKFTNLFPSIHTSYKLSDGLSLQGGYSRRIYRPRLWDLNPFFNIRNNFSIRTGNPTLRSEFTDSYEVGSIFIFNKVSFNLNVFHRYTIDKIERVSTFVNEVNIFRPENIGTDKASGLELNFKYSPQKKITISGDVNYSVFKREGTFGDQEFDFSADQWSGKLTSKYKVSKSLDVEVTARHESRRQTIQGMIKGNTFMDFGLRYKILKGRGVFSMSVRDVFASRIRQNTVDQEDFHLYSHRQRGRFITLGFSYGFGKGEAMEYSGRRRR